MAKREPLFEADFSDNGGLLRLWDAQDVERFIAEEQSFWRVIHEGDMSTPFNVVHNLTIQMGEALRSAVEKRDQDAGNAALATYYGVPTNRIPLSRSVVGEAIGDIFATSGREAARGALAIALPTQLWSDGIGPSSRPFWRGLVQQVMHESGLTPRSIEAARRTMNGLNGRASQILAGIEDRAAEQVQAATVDFEKALAHQDARNTELERQRLGALHAFQQRAGDVSERLEATHAAYLEQMRLKAPVQYWSDKASGHRRSARDLKFFVWGFFALMIGGYVIAFAGLHQQVADFLLQFKESTGALLVISAAFALLASLPLWVGRLLVKFYLSEHHLATDAREREVMTQTYLALTAEGKVDEKDRALVLAALFRSTPDGVVKDNTQPDTSPAALLSKLLDGR